MATLTTTRQGVVEGAREAAVRVFRGIPYASPPTGALRLLRPQPARAWTGTRRCVRPAAAAIQRSLLPAPLRRWSAVPRAGASEDCLYLNVWTPGCDTRRRAVLVWLHGGGFTHGSGSWFVYSGQRLARRGDVVVVTLNYRLGALGALDLRGLGVPAGEGGADTNVGLADQLAALRWVRDNIEAFGGDPENVTLFGQSSGAMSAGALLACPPAEGLFQRAILQSGALRNVLSPEQAQGVAEHLLAELDLRPRGRPLADALRSLPAGRLHEAQLKVSARHRLPLGMMCWQPVVDGGLLPSEPLRAVRAGESSNVPLLLGTNRDEWRMFTALDRKRRNLDAATLRGYLERSLARDGDDGRERARAALAVYGCMAEGEGARSAAEIWVAFQTDRVFLHPAIQLAEAHAAAGRVARLYRFAWQPPIGRERIGACHSLEIPFVFGSSRHPLLRPLFGATSSALALADRMQDAWLAFARDGSPEHAGLRDWPAYTSASPGALVLDLDVYRDEAMGFDARGFWSDAEA